ncbi:MAG: hypothetical protein EAZ43_09570 [Betaproteobacteria bacterium]|nr:MAG: hypothetical protein EAZ43_09570 [Betaproteobacteria bacterium]
MPLHLRICSIVCLASALQATAVIACPLTEPALKKGDITAIWSVDGPAIAVGKHFALNVRVCPVDSKLVRVNATMPEHRHGMNYRASVKPLSDGLWRVEGMMFHMPGRWELRLDVQSATQTETLVDNVNLR